MSHLDKYGYVEVYLPNHPAARKNGYVAEHRLVAEEKIGRYLTKEECVHHVNEIKSDNSPENLMVLTHSEHRRLHNLNHPQRIHIDWNTVDELMGRGLSQRAIGTALGVSERTISRKLKYRTEARLESQTA